MVELLALAITGALCIFVIPPLIPPHLRSWFVDNIVRVIVVVIILFAVATTSFVFVPDGHIGHLFRVYGGGPLNEGRIVAAKAENGPQAEIFTPGFHARFFLNVIYHVDTNQEE